MTIDKSLFIRALRKEKLSTPPICQNIEKSGQNSKIFLICVKIQMFAVN